MLKLDFPEPKYKVGDRVIFHPKNQYSYGNEELRFIGKVGIIMPWTGDDENYSDLPMVRFDKSTRKLCISQDDLIDYVDNYTPLQFCNSGHLLYGDNVYRRRRAGRPATLECRTCRQRSRAFNRSTTLQREVSMHRDMAALA